MIGIVKVIDRNPLTVEVQVGAHSLRTVGQGFAALSRAQFVFPLGDIVVAGAPCMVTSVPVVVMPRESGVVSPSFTTSNDNPS